MNEPTGLSKDYRGHEPPRAAGGAVTPNGEPLAPLLDSLMEENLDPRTVADTCEHMRTHQIRRSELMP